MAVEMVDSWDKIHFPNPFVLKKFCEENLYVPPLLFDPSPAGVAALIDKHRDELGYSGDPYHPRKADGFIYKTFCLAAKVLEQRKELFSILFSETCPETSPHKEIWTAFHIQKRLFWMPMNVDNQEMDTISFVPAFQILASPDENDSGWLCRVGVPGGEVGLKTPLPYYTFRADNLKAALEYGYQKFQELRDQEEALLNQILQRKYSEIPKSLTAYYAAYNIKNLPEHEYYFVGNNPMMIARIDPHSQYALTALDAKDAGLSFTIAFEASTPLQAVLKAQAFSQLAHLDNELEFPEVFPSDKLYALMDFAGMDAVDLYSGESVQLFKTHLTGFQVYHLYSQRGDSLLVVTKDTVQPAPIKNKVFAFVFDGAPDAFCGRLQARLKHLTRFVRKPCENAPDKAHLSFKGFLVLENDIVQVIRVKNKKMKVVDRVLCPDDEPLMSLVGLALLIR